jgi:hypothetical protein
MRTRKLKWTSIARITTKIQLQISKQVWVVLQIPTAPDFYTSLSRATDSYGSRFLHKSESCYRHLRLQISTQVWVVLQTPTAPDFYTSLSRATDTHGSRFLHKSESCYRFLRLQISTQVWVMLQIPTATDFYTSLSRATDSYGYRFLHKSECCPFDGKPRDRQIKKVFQTAWLLPAQTLDHKYFRGTFRKTLQAVFGLLGDARGFVELVQLRMKGD